MRSSNDSAAPARDGACSGPECGCGAAPAGLGRRAFLKAAGAAAVAAGIRPWKAVAGPFTAADFEQLVPADKRLKPEWVKALTERGQPEVWRGSELRYIGMPVGGVGCGQLYLGGDGRLWHWEIFKPTYTTDYSSVTTGPHYAAPLRAVSNVEQGFALRVTSGAKTHLRALDAEGFRDVSFRGEYPMGKVQYRDPGCPVAVDLDAFAPFIPLDPESSATPATFLQLTLKNTGRERVEVEIAGWLQNAVCLYDDQPALGIRRNRVTKRDRALVVESSAEAPSWRTRHEKRPDIVFETFEREEYEGWTASGTAFGAGPVERSRMPAYQGDVGARGRRLVNTHNARGGEDVGKADAHVGTLISKPFTIERDFITFLIGGGHHPGKTCLNLLVDGKVAATATGHNDNRMRPEAFDVSALSGKTARLEIVDQAQGGWGNIGIDEIVFTDEIPSNKRLERLPGYGTMALALLRTQRSDMGAPAVGLPVSPFSVFNALHERKPGSSVTLPFGQKLVGAIGRKLSLKGDESVTVTFLLTWFFPQYQNPIGEMAAIAGLSRMKRHYARRFDSAGEVVAHLSRHFDSQVAQTRLWNQTWYDSTLPYWFLDRTFIPIDTLATTTSHLFDTGRFYGWEGVDCCPGTCQHVWQYAQGLARIFPQIERDLRERVDFGLSWHDNGAMDYRAENGRNVAHDGFAGTIIRAYREHQMSPDSAFLQRIWPRVRKSIEYLMGQDKDENGLIEGEQFNTLDAAWYGPMAWISSLYLAALQAGRAMALEMNDSEFAERCARILRAGQKNLVQQLFNGEYFIHKPDPKHPDSTNTNDGCHIDQVFGQSYAWQVGLERILPEKETVQALLALWKYNFTPDIGPYRKNFKAITSGRWYAMPGEGGLLMCTWPRGGAEKAAGKGNPVFVGYFNECMTGFEYQVAAHMIWEGLVTEGMAITRTVHDRYHAAKRNPYNEVECSDHYSRAMMSYGVFLAACGFEYHGPKARLAFAPRVTPENFRAPFTASEGWGTLSQLRDGKKQQNRVDLRWGKLRLRVLGIEVDGDNRGTEVVVSSGGKRLDVVTRRADRRITIQFASELTLAPGQWVEVLLS